MNAATAQKIRDAAKRPPRAVDLRHCPHRPSRVSSWFAADGTLCIACNDCGAVLAGAA